MQIGKAKAFGFLICLKGLTNRDKSWAEGGVLRFF